METEPEGLLAWVLGLNPPLELAKIDDGFGNGFPLKLLLMGSLLSEFLGLGFGFIDDIDEQEEESLFVVAMKILISQRFQVFWVGDFVKIWKENESFEPKYNLERSWWEWRERKELVTASFLSWEYLKW